MATSDSATVVSVDGHRVKLTNLDKVMYPETGTTKADVLDYYARVADVLIPHAANRPLTRKRWVHGVGTDEHPGQMFFQKNLDEGAPSWVHRRSIEHRSHANEYPLLNDRATLTWFAQMAALELHVPQWQFGRTGAQKNPDRIVFDLDPGDGAGLAECAEVARFVQAILADMGLEAMPVTSGSKGIHLYAALDGRQDSDQVSAVAHELARALEADHPDLVVSDMKKTLRAGKVLVDWSQNNGNKTTIAPYSLRGRPHPMVAAPRTWRELASKDLHQLDYREVLRRVARRGDPLADLTIGHLSSLEPTPEHMATFESTDAARDRLQKYRSMRDAKRTPEPVPEAASGTSTGMSFVIQEHHARALHWDFRLEHDGVLVSWALPKGVPTDPGKNHLAVQTEDHPLEYGTFEGSIPAGEYGGGQVTIWDAGTYELEKWRDGKEVICTIHGEKHGSHKYALIHTGGRGGTADSNWLIHLMKTDEEETDHSPSAVTTTPTRPKRGRTVVGGARGRRKAIEPMLATLGSEADLEDGDDWAFEMKWDGIRAVATIVDGSVTLVSRNGNDLTHAYPDLADLPAAVEGDAVVDGEIVALDRRGRPDFGLLQGRMNLTKDAEIRTAAKATPVHYVAFDLLETDGESRLKDSYTERRRRLESIVSTSGRMQVPPAFDGDAAAAIASSLELGLEGIVAKKTDSTYSLGRRGRDWIKIKHHFAQEVVIGGWRPGNGRRSNQVGSLLMGIPDGDGLRYVGRVGTGFRDSDLLDLTARLKGMERKTSPFDDVPRADASDAHWITPRIVGEVEFAEWTATGRLRQPSWRGLRPDKRVDQVVREAP